jgi:lambda family phage portal protein
MAFPFNLFRRPAAPAAKRQLEGASGRRFMNTPAFSGAGPEVLASGAQVARNAARLVFNDAHAANAQSIYCTGLVGSGAVGASGLKNDDHRNEQDSAFANWDKRVNFAAVQTEVVNEWFISGECFVIMRQNAESILDLQVIPSSQVDDSYTTDLANGGYVAAGIQYDARDRPVAYHFRPHRPTGTFLHSYDRITVNARDVLHIFRKKAAGQTRGLSPMASVIIAMNEHAQLQDAALMNAKIQSMMVGFVTDQNNTSGVNPFGDGEQSGGLTDISLEPGVMRVLPAGWSVQFSDPKQANEAVGIMSTSLRAIAAGLQIPEFLLSGDMRGVNYSSARTALIQFRQLLEQIQFTCLVPLFFDPIWRRFCLLESLSGRMDVDADTDISVEWHFPAAPWIDPLKDAEATALMIDRGLMSRRQAVAALGYSIEALDTEIASDRAREKAKGLTFDNLASAPRQPATTESTDD